MTRRLIPTAIGRASFIVVVCAAVAITAGTAFAAPAAPKATTSHIHVMKIFKGVHQQNIRTASTNLVYQGGAVEPTPVVYISWWGSQWNTGFSTGGYTSAKAQTYITDFFNNVGGTHWDNINTQYCQGIAAGSTSCGSGGTHITNPTGQLKGTWVDTTSVPTPAHTVTDPERRYPPDESLRRLQCQRHLLCVHADRTLDERLRHQLVCLAR